MIAEIKIHAEYGRNTDLGISKIHDADDETSSVFAHSTQDAVEWLSKYPLFQDAERLENGRTLVVTSHWIEYDGKFENLLWPEDNPHLNAEYTRQVAVIVPRNTIYENNGYKGYEKPRD